MCRLARVQHKSVITGLAHVKEEMLQQLSIRVRTSQHHHSARCLNTPDTCSHVLCVEDMVLVTSRVTGLARPKGPNTFRCDLVQHQDAFDHGIKHGERALHGPAKVFFLCHFETNSKTGAFGGELEISTTVCASFN